jgi:hypothetical protein
LTRRYSTKYQYFWPQEVLAWMLGAIVLLWEVGSRGGHCVASEKSTGLFFQCIQIIYEPNHAIEICTKNGKNQAKKSKGPTV